VRDRFGRGAVTPPRGEDDDYPPVKARAEFWAELRAGQREAAAQIANLDSARATPAAAIGLPGVIVPAAGKDGA
jgi:hypothetical protein